MLKNYVFFILLAFSTNIAGQNFAGTGGVIKDDASRNQFTIAVSGIASSIDSKFGVFGVSVNLTHSYTADLNIFLIAPDNTLIELSTGNGGNGKNYTNCLFTNNSNYKISSAKAPFKGNFKPEGSIGVVNNSQNPNASWRLIIVDTKPNRDSGTLLGWNIIFNGTPSKLEPFVNSNLPLILINTFGQFIPDEPKVWANMRIINNIGSNNAVGDSVNYFNYGIAIETRGSSSQSFPKKPYGFSTVLKNLADTNVSLLGLPAEHDWVLNATYNDKSLMRDVLAYELARRSGRYATRYRYCELFINGNYEGIYILMEKVKRDKNRVDITKLELKDSTGNALTGGYIVKIDKTTGNNNGGWTDTFPISTGSSVKVYFQYDYPNGDDMVKKQRDYIASAIYKFEVALASSTFASPTAGYRQYADESTFIDLSIINEISKNVDGYRLSTYMYKDRDSKGGKLKMGPVWDFNLAFNNADYNNSSDPTGWEIDLSYGCPFWWKRFRADTGYVNSYYCRWNQLRQSTFSLYKINKFIDSTYKVIEEASYRNLQRWPVMGIYVWPNPSPLSYSVKEEVDSLKGWIEKRVKWMDATLAVDCKTVKTCAPRVGVFADKKTVCKYQPIKLYADGIGTTFKWSPSKGLNTTNGREVTATLDTTTTFKVVMQTASGCKDSAVITITVLPLPAKTLSGKTIFCQGDSSILSAPAGYKTYLWSPATGLDNTATNKVIASPVKNTDYKVVITDAQGCFDSAYISLTVNKTPNVIISAVSDTICSMDSILLTVKGANSYQWLPAFGLNTTGGNTAMVHPQNTKYTVIGTSDKGCTDTTSYIVFNYPPAPLSIEADAVQLCYGSGATLTARKGSYFTWRHDGSHSDIVKVFPKADTEYQVTGLNKYGCSDSAVITIAVYPETKLYISGDSNFCENDKTTLTLSGANTYRWSPTNGIDTTTDAAIFIASPKINTDYLVTGLDKNDCLDSANFTIEVYPKPALKITGNNTICKGDKTTLKVTGANDYLWSPAIYINTTTGDEINASPIITGSYKAIGTSANLCSDTAEIVINVNTPPVLQITTSTLTIEEGQSDTIRVSGAFSYLWTPGLSLNTDKGNTVIASPVISTTYKVTGTDNKQCSTTDSVFITVTKKQVGLHKSHLFDFNIYPNPASDVVSIESPVNAYLIISTIQGTVIYNSQISQGKTNFNSETLASGVYIFCLETKEGRQFYRIVIN